jgi:C-terminal processing protease CtpA/Prc
VVRRSLAADIHPGDTIVALEGRPIEEVYAEELSRTSAAILGYQLDIADRYSYGMNGPLALTLEDPEGVQRHVNVPLQPLNDYFAAVDPLESARPSGLLGNVGAPDLYYLNLNTFNTPTDDDALLALEEATALDARGLILDMRGYPAVDGFAFAQQLIPNDFLSPRFEITSFAGPNEGSVIRSQLPIPGLGDAAFQRPIVLIVGPHSVSADENLMQMLVGAGRLSAIVGRNSAGTNGNITELSLPGGFAFSYTGMKVENPDGSRFHGVGIVPDHEVAITAADLRDGIDRALLEAVRVFDEELPE